MDKFIEMKQQAPDYYTEITIDDLKTPITVLLGPNGTGKSMSLRLMQQECKLRNIKYTTYSTSRDDIVAKSSPAVGDWDIAGIACAFHSEGERMCDSFNKWANSTFLRTLLEDKECPVYIFVDEADSGLSLDRMIQTLVPIVHIMEMDSKHRDVHLVITCNSYEMAEILKSDITRFIWVPTKEEISITSYNDFALRYISYCEKMFIDKED